MSENLASLYVWDVAKVANLSLIPSRVLNHELHEWGMRRGRESVRWNS